MALAFPQLSWWLWSGKHRDSKASDGPPLYSSTDVSLWELDTLKFSLVNGGGSVASTSRRAKRKWPSRKERKVDKEYDVVLVPSDGDCFSGSESDGSDYSIGWSEPHGPGFQRDDDPDASFAFLIRCYGRGHAVEKDPKDRFSATIGNKPDLLVTENTMYTEEWLSSLLTS